MTWDDHARDFYFSTDNDFTNRFATKRTLAGTAAVPPGTIEERRLICRTLTGIFPDSVYYSPGFNNRPCPWLVISYFNAANFACGQDRVALFFSEEQHYLGFQCDNSAEGGAGAIHIRRTGRRDRHCPAWYS